jgi:hypothetical protein
MKLTNPMDKVCLTLNLKCIFSYFSHLQIYKTLRTNLKLANLGRPKTSLRDYFKFTQPEVDLIEYIWKLENVKNLTPIQPIILYIYIFYREHVLLRMLSTRTTHVKAATLYQTTHLLKPEMLMRSSLIATLN